MKKLGLVFLSMFMLKIPDVAHAQAGCLVAETASQQSLGHTSRKNTKASFPIFNTCNFCVSATVRITHNGSNAVTRNISIQGQRRVTQTWLFDATGSDRLNIAISNQSDCN
ncbi:MAG: hypothetical protein AAGB04_21560 [Pseudomonadota bacterium]